MQKAIPKALRVTQDRLDSRNFHAFNPAFNPAFDRYEDCGCNK